MPGLLIRSFFTGAALFLLFARGVSATDEKPQQPGHPKAAPSAASAVAAEPGAPRAEPLEYDSRPENFSLVPAPINSAALSPDGSWIAGGTAEWGRPGDLLLWDAATRQLKFRQHFNQGVAAVAFSPDNAWLAAGSFTGEVVLVDVARATLAARWNPRNEAVSQMVFSPDSSILASASRDASVKLWNVVPLRDPNTGLPSRLVFDAHTGPVLSAAFAPDGKTLYTGCRDQKVFAWDLQKRRKVAVWSNLSTAVAHLAVSPDGEAVAAGLWDGTVQIRKRTDGAVIATLDHGAERGRVTRVAFARKAPLLSSTSGDGSVKVWDWPEGTLRATIDVQADQAFAAEITADGGRLLATGADGILRMWDAGTKQEIFQLRSDAGIAETDSPIVASAWSRDGSVLATVHADDSIRLRDPQTGNTVKTGTAPVELLAALALSPDGRRLAAAGEDRALYLWDVAEELGTPRVLRGHTARVTSVAFAPDGKTVFSGSRDGTVREWDAVSEKIGRTFDSENDKLLAVALSADGDWLAAAGHGRIVHLWNLARPAGSPPLSLRGHAAAVTALAFAPDQLFLASAGDDRRVTLWNLTGFDATLQRPVARRFFFGPQESVVSLAFSPKGKWLAAASLDKTVRLWEAGPGPSLQTLTTANVIHSLAFAAGDFRLLGVGSDRTLSVWRGSHGTAFPATEGRYVWLRALSEVNEMPWTTIAEMRLFTGETMVPQQEWKLISVDSAETDTPATFAFDGNPRTFWGTPWRSGATRHPHEIVIDLGQTYRLTGFTLLPRQDGSPNGTVKDYELYVSNDPKNFGPPVSKGQSNITPLP